MTKKTADTIEVVANKDFIPPFTVVKPVANQVLIERISESELLNSTIFQTSGDKPSNQAFILAIGPTVPEIYGLKVGMRVLVVGTSTLVPKNGNEKREKNLCLPDMIKAVLE